MAGKKRPITPMAKRLRETADAAGKRRQKWITVKGTKRDAEREMTRLLHERHSNLYVEPTRLTLAQHLEEWLVRHKRHVLSPVSYDRYCTAVRVHLTPALGKVPISRLTALQIQQYYSGALDTLSPRTVAFHHQVLYDSLRQAVRWRLIAVNPVDQVERPKPHDVERPTLSEEQVAQLLGTAATSRYYVAILLAITTGMRRNEILALRWQDVDLQSGTLSVRRSLEKSTQGTRYKEPKTQKGKRPIELPSIVVEALVRHKAVQSAERLTVGCFYQNEDLVTARENGAPHSPSVVSRGYADIARSLGFPSTRFHDLRHTHATLLLAQGEHPKIVAERLGHAGVIETLDRYSHVMPHLQRATAARFDVALRRAMGG